MCTGYPQLKSVYMRSHVAVMFLGALGSFAVDDDGARLFAWIRSGGNGTGFIDERLQLRRREGERIRGIFAAEAMPKDTMFAWVPGDRILEAAKGDGDALCLLIDRLHHGIELGDQSPLAPYMAIMEAHDTSSLADMWLAPVRELLARIPPYDFGRHLMWWLGTCAHQQADQLQPVDQRRARAALLAVARAVSITAEHRSLVPLYDMLNHRNWPWYNTRWDYDESGMKLFLTRAVEKGEELYNSYGRYDEDARGSPEIFRDYSFVEQYPSEWWFYDAACAAATPTPQLSDATCLKHHFTLVDGSSGAQWPIAVVNGRYASSPTSSSIKSLWFLVPPGVIGGEEVTAEGPTGSAVITLPEGKVGGDKYEILFVDSAEELRQSRALGAQALVKELESAMARAIEMRDGEGHAGTSDAERHTERQQLDLLLHFFGAYRDALHIALRSLEGHSEGVAGALTHDEL